MRPGEEEATAALMDRLLYYDVTHKNCANAPAPSDIIGAGNQRLPALPDHATKDTWTQSYANTPASMR